MHNHKIAQCRKKYAITSNPTLTPLDVTCGKGLGFIPSAVDAACSHPGKVGYEVKLIIK